MTNQPTLMARFTELVDAYREHCAALVRRYPAQAANMRHFAHELETARLGRMRRVVTTKGNHSTYETGDLVLVWGRDPSPVWTSCTVWHPRNHCQTSVDRYAVEMAVSA